MLKVQCLCLTDMPNQEFDEAVTTMHYNIQKNVSVYV